MTPWIFGSAGLLLALIITVFAVTNYQREKVLMFKVLDQEGKAVLSLTGTAIRAAVRERLRWGDFNPESWREVLQDVVEQGAEHGAIKALFLIDGGTGLIIAHTDPGLRNSKASMATMGFLEGQATESPGVVSRVVDSERDGEQVYQIGSAFQFFGPPGEPMPLGRDLSRWHGGRMMRERLPPGLESMVGELSGRRLYLAANLDMTDYRTSVRKQLVQIVILSFVLLLVGLGALISMLLLQGFKGSQQRLRRISEFTEVLVSSMPLGVAAVDQAGLIQTCNVSFCRMFELDQQQLDGKNYRSVWPRDLRQILEPNAKLPAGRRIELRRSPGGGEQVLAVELVTIRSELQEPAGTMVIVQDLTVQKRLEQEVRRNERHAALGKMAAGVAHELRNPLSSIKGLTLLIKARVGGDGNLQETADLMISEVERLDRSIGELLSYARPENLNLEPLDMQAVLDRALMLIESDATAAGIEVNASYEFNGRLVSGDRDRLTQVFLNLMINSIQAMGDGGRLKLRGTVEGDQAVIEIGDSGSGIAPELLEKVFDPYFTTKNEGTGLGLSLSAKLVEDHHGSIGVTSEPGRGTTVTVRLPLG